VRPRPSIGSAVLILLALGAIAYYSLVGGGAGDAVGGDESGWARVVRVVDGDTVILAGLGSSRIVGVDTPETVKPDTPVQCFGPRASAFSKHVLGAAGRVRYRVAPEPVDAYGRRLVYLWLPDGRFFNALLIRRGLARPLPFPPNTRYAPLFARLAE
jgi:micrococcal nuclease